MVRKAQATEVTVRRQLRFSNAAWISLVAMPLLTWLVLAGQTVTYRSPAPATSDPLMSKFMARIVLEITRPHRDYDYIEEHALPAAELASWAGEFGDDPRYWMLCYYFCDGPPEGTQPGSVITDRHSRVYYLEEARRRGVADAQVLMELFRQYEWAWRYEADNATRAWLTPGADRRESNRLIWQYVDEQHGAEYAALLADVLAGAGDHSWPYYEAALVESERGELAAAWELLVQGNAAPLNRALLGFPYNAIYRQFWDGQPSEDRITAGIVCESGMGLPLSDYIRYKEMVKRLVEDARAREDLAALSVLNTFACRFGAMENAVPIQALVGKVMIDYAHDAAEQNWPVQHSAAQRLALSQLDQKSGRVSMAVRQLNANWPMQLYGPGGPLDLLKHPEVALGGDLGLRVVWYETFHDQAFQELSLMGAQIASDFAEIGRFDYATLSWPEK
ncbi:hypothetical protein JW859_03540 [bacterium]|nr:hypothetical protein [bacterium]